MKERFEEAWNPNPVFPETDTFDEETRSTELLLSGEAEHLALA